MKPSPPDDPDPPIRPEFTLLLRPALDPSPRVHVEIDARRGDRSRLVWRIALGAPERIENAAAHDDSGEVPLQVAANMRGVALTLGHEPHGVMHLGYDVIATGDDPGDPLGLLVADGRFRGSGERLVAITPALEETYLRVELRIDGAPLKLPAAASSLGVGASRRATLPVGDLRYAAFLAGRMGTMIIDDSAGHDEGAWLGYTAFDPRPTVAELAVVRSGLSALFGGQTSSAWTHLILAQTQATAPFSTTPRASSLLLQVPVGDPWGSAARLAVAQELARRFIGGELRFATTKGHEREAHWFNVGFARWAAIRVLSELTLFGPDDVRDAVVAELSVLATSPYRSTANAELSAIASGDASDSAVNLARTTLAARGALYAARTAYELQSLEKGGSATGRSPLGRLLSSFPYAGGSEATDADLLTATRWKQALGELDRSAPDAFERYIVRGEPFGLPPGALGPCFRSAAGQYVEFDPGFDVEATRHSHRVAGVRAGGPAARGGIRDGDAVVALLMRDGDASTKVRFTLTRDSADGGSAKPFDVSYLPAGRRARGQTFLRIANMPDDRCGVAP